MTVKELKERLDSVLNDSENNRKHIENAEVMMNVESYRYPVKDTHLHYSESSKEFTFELFDY